MDGRIDQLQALAHLDRVGGKRRGWLATAIESECSDVDQPPVST